MSPRGFWMTMVAVLAFTIGLEIAFSDVSHAEFPWHRFPSFDFFYGLVGCAVIVLLSKWLGSTFLQRDESYYDKEKR